MNSRSCVYETIEGNNPKWVPKQLWVLPWAEDRFPDELKQIRSDFPDDIVSPPSDGQITAEGFSIRDVEKTGHPYKQGKYTDPWGCQFISLNDGIIGEVRHPVVQDEDWKDITNIQLPEEALDINKNEINTFCRNTDKFVTAGDNIRPFERLQFIRGTEALYMDLLLKPTGMIRFMEKLHDYYCRLLNIWADTDVDALLFMDDWGSQNNLLINPRLWIEMFKPLYREYVDIAHKHDKKIFMHCDGNILDIIPHLIDIGVDAINSQVFCMGLDKLEPFKGEITFWGEMDRQNLLVNGTPEQIKQAVFKMREKLWLNGGVIAQCEFGPGAKPENIRAYFEAWL